MKAILECRSNFSFLPSISRYKDLVPTSLNTLSPAVAAEMQCDAYSYNPNKAVKLSSSGRNFSSHQEATKDSPAPLKPGNLHINLPDTVREAFVTDTVTTDKKSKPSTSFNDESEIYSQHSIPPRISTNADFTKQNKYYVCNIVRHQSTLWTSYRLYLDHVMEISSTGELLPDSTSSFTYRHSNNMSNIIDSHSSNEIEVPSQSRSNDADKPSATSSTSINPSPLNITNPVSSSRGIFLLGAKKLKSVSLSSQWCVWDSTVSPAADSKSWKEKNATGKVHKERFF